LDEISSIKTVKAIRAENTFLLQDNDCPVMRLLMGIFRGILYLL
jgi:hypothetical protein